MSYIEIPWNYACDTDCHIISLLRGLVGSWLTPGGGAPGYKAVGRAHIHDSITINTINLPSCSCALPAQIDNIYKVERILDKRVICRGRGFSTQYWIRWKGWGPEHDKWKRVQDLNCDELIEEYEQRIQQNRT
jgi:hypothetical protein